MVSGFSFSKSMGKLLFRLMVSFCKDGKVKLSKADCVFLFFKEFFPTVIKFHNSQSFDKLNQIKKGYPIIKINVPWHFRTPWDKMFFSWSHLMVTKFLFVNDTNWKRVWTFHLSLARKSSHTFHFLCQQISTVINIYLYKF